MEQSNAAELFETLTEYEKRAVKTVKMDDVIWFRGKDIAEILEYKDTDKAIRIHVPEKYRKSLRDIFDPAILAGSKFPASNLKTIYIKEAGIYCLISHSKKKEAELFRDWVLEELLPKLRKQGSYSMNQEYIKKLEEETERAKQLVLEFKEKEEAAQEKLNRLQKINSDLLSYKKRRERSESVYVLSSYTFASQGLFKIGRTKNIRGRTTNHNTSHPVGDKMKVLQEFKVHDAALVENILHKKLDGLRPAENREFFMAPLDLLIEFINLVVERDINEDERADYLVDKVYELISKGAGPREWIDPVVLESLKEDSEMKLIEGGETVVTFNVSKLSAEQKSQFIKDCIAAYDSQFGRRADIYRWWELQTILIDLLNIPKSRFKAGEWRDPLKEESKKRGLQVMWRRSKE